LCSWKDRRKKKRATVKGEWDRKGEAWKSGKNGFEGY